MATRTVHLAVYDTMADWEVGYATAHINSGAWQREPGSARVVTVGENAEPITTMGGMTIVPDLTVDEVTPTDSAMLILPGAETWMTGGNTVFADKARQLLDAGVPVAAICGATVGLATAGLLDDRQHTSNHPAPLLETGYQGADLYRDEPAISDRNLITASANAPVEFAREILGMLDLYEPGVVDSWFKLYGDGDPQGYFELIGAAG